MSSESLKNYHISVIERECETGLLQVKQREWTSLGKTKQKIFDSLMVQWRLLKVITNILNNWFIWSNLVNTPKNSLTESICRLFSVGESSFRLESWTKFDKKSLLVYLNRLMFLYCTKINKVKSNNNALNWSH